jgi:hypothetical protein
LGEVNFTTGDVTRRVSLLGISNIGSVTNNNFSGNCVGIRLVGERLSRKGGPVNRPGEATVCGSLSHGGRTTDPVAQAQHRPSG